MSIPETLKNAKLIFTVETDFYGIHIWNLTLASLSDQKSKVSMVAYT